MYTYYDFFGSLQGPQACNNSSCQEIHRCFPSAPSGNYQILSANNTVVEVYCDMEGTTCESEGGWMRVAYVNMPESGATCPQGLSQRIFSGLTLCGRSMDGCQSTMFSTLGLNYSHACMWTARGYQYYTPDAFGEVEKFNTINGP